MCGAIPFKRYPRLNIATQFRGIRSKCVSRVACTCMKPQNCCRWQLSKTPFDIAQRYFSPTTIISSTPLPSIIYLMATHLPTLLRHHRCGSSNLPALRISVCHRQRKGPLERPCDALSPKIIMCRAISQTGMWSIYIPLHVLWMNLLKLSMQPL